MLAMLSFAIGLIAIFLGVIVNPLNRAAIFNQRGHITSGNFAGIEVGMSQAAALSRVRTNFPQLELVGPNADNRCFDLRLNGEEFVQIYDATWRGGTICMAFARGRVASVAWRFNSLAI